MKQDQGEYALPSRRSTVARTTVPGLQPGPLRCVLQYDSVIARREASVEVIAVRTARVS